MTVFKYEPFWNRFPFLLLFPHKKGTLKSEEIDNVLLDSWKFGVNPTRSRHCDKPSFKSDL